MKVRRVFWIVLSAWLLPVAAVSVYLVRAPNVVTRQADAGSFVSAQIQPPGIFHGATTSVQTTHGILFVSDVFTAPMGERLVLRDSTEHGVQLCRRGSEDACADLAGRYVGDIPAIPGVHAWLTHSLRQSLETARSWWFLFGLAGTSLVAVWAMESDRKSR